MLAKVLRGPAWNKKTLTPALVADERGMMLSVPLPWLVVTACAGVLLVMGRRNKASGWRRERRSVVGDTLMTWAVARQSDTVVTQCVPPQGSPARSLDLIALHSAVGSSSAVSSNSGPSQQDIAAAGDTSALKSPAQEPGIAVK